MEKLSFGHRNSKLNKLAEFLKMNKTNVVSFDLPAGYTCPCANLCKSFANPFTGKIHDGKSMKYRCYAASGEALYPNARLSRWNNYNLLRNSDNMAGLIEASLPKSAKIVRIHSSGDFFNPDYFQAWNQVAKNHPEISFFGYTKILPYVKAEKPDNFSLVYSYGGLMDNQLTDEPACYVIQTVLDGEKMGIPVACQVNPSDDYFYIIGHKSFGIVLHGTQPHGAKALTV